MTYPRCSIRYVLDCAKLAMLCSCFIYNALYILLTLVTSKILTGYGPRKGEYMK